MVNFSNSAVQEWWYELCQSSILSLPASSSCVFRESPPPHFSQSGMASTLRITPLTPSVGLERIHEVASCLYWQGGASFGGSFMCIGSCTPPPPRSHFPLCRHSRGCIKDTIPHWLPISKYLKVCLMKRLAKQEFFSLDWIHFTLLQMSITVFRCLPWFGFKHNFLAFLSLFLGENVPSYRRQRVEDRQLCTQCERFYLRGDSAWDEESQGVSGSVCKGGRLQESGTYLPAGVNLMKMSNLKLTHMVKNHFCCLIVQI